VHKRPPKPACMTLNLAPMVDVMMCLIIFFLLASKLASEHFPVDLPWAVAAKSVDDTAAGDQVTITVRRAQDTDAMAEYVVTDWDGQRIIERQLQPAEVERLLQARALVAQRTDRPLRCVIRADRQVRYEHVEVVLRACGLAKISHIIFPANKGSEPLEGA
jgi:biopolymer transport protein ExbD